MPIASRRSPRTGVASFPPHPSLPVETGTARVSNQSASPAAWQFIPALSFPPFSAMKSPSLHLLAALAAFLSPLCLAADGASAIPPAGTARTFPIADSLAGEGRLQAAIAADGASQCAAFFASDATLSLARRIVGRDDWVVARTAFRGQDAEPSRTVSLAVDGAGILHVVWAGATGPLNYARGAAPGSLELGPRRTMTGRGENRVAEPRLLGLPDGDILFLHRDESAPPGGWMISRYAFRRGTWTQVRAGLLGADVVPGSLAAAVDAKGRLHLAWFRADPRFPATGRELCYARSADGGNTWTAIDGSALRASLAGPAARVLSLDGGADPLSAPGVTADAEGHPFIAGCWRAKGASALQYQLIHAAGAKWETVPVTRIDGAPGRPPSPCAIAIQRSSRKPTEVYLAYRDDDAGGRLVMAVCRNLVRPEWKFEELTAGPVGAWAPALDAAAWRRFTQVHLLVGAPPQPGGPAGALPMSSLLWSPLVSGFPAAPAPPAAVPAFSISVDPAAVRALMERVADWQLARPYPYPANDWKIAPFSIGALALDAISASPKYHDAVLAQAERDGWKPAQRLYHADDHCVMQVYLALHRRHRDARMIAPSRERLDAVLAAPVDAPLDWGFPHTLDRWSWCDALFMAPVSWLMMYEETGDRRYLDFMNREWWATTAALYVRADGLYARDQSFLDLREPNCRRIFWARGNGWVAAGLARLLAHLPADHPDRPRYVALFRGMMDALLAAQQPDGLWRIGILDPAAHQEPETSGSSFITFALAWGVNQGLLDRARFEPAARRAWTALAACVAADGKLEHVQPVGVGPEGFAADHTEPFGAGAFLLAGSEVYRLAGGTAPAQRQPSTS